MAWPENLLGFTYLERLTPGTSGCPQLHLLLLMGTWGIRGWVGQRQSGLEVPISQDHSPHFLPTTGTRHTGVVSHNSYLYSAAQNHLVFAHHAILMISEEDGTV